MPALLRSQFLSARYLHYVIVVDEDIDPSNISQVLWALGTRRDPADAIDFIKGQVSAFLDPTISPEKRRQGDSTSSVAIILACKPYHWMDQFPPPIEVSPELTKEIQEKWKELF